eukprot:scaffold66936_cov19-Tisochrysis_lutea.AAC.4
MAGAQSAAVSRAQTPCATQFTHIHTGSPPRPPPPWRGHEDSCPCQGTTPDAAAGSAGAGALR